MLRNLLQSYAEMRVPEAASLHFILVENNDRPTLHHIVAWFRQLQPQWTLQYEVEPRRGIAYARNRVLQCALAADGELLTFADDDETVAIDWLIQLLAERDTANLDIVGSPVRLAPPPCDASLWARLIWSGMDRANRHYEAKALRNRNAGRADRIRLATGSWMGNLAFFRRTALTFDNELGLAGGEDWLLWAEARKRGATTGWTPHAVAYETIPLERLSLRYLYRRDRDHSITAFRKKLEANRTAGLLRLPGSLAGRTLRLGMNVTAIPFKGEMALVRAASCLGSIAGLFQACLGRTSSHYDRTSGS
ncbi:hypothetical protein EV217_5010 [Phyllobacterium myrsinacearum]|nr:hypothetical protein EV217_5010 [Phyllobacterium myrsinacearum]